MKKILLLQNQDISFQSVTQKPSFSRKFEKLSCLLENSQSFQTKKARINTPYNQGACLSFWRDKKKQEKLIKTPSSVSSFLLSEKSGQLSKDLPLFLSLTEKPVNLLFSLDQFVFEFSKTTYQQRKTGEFFHQLKERKKLSLFYGHLTRKQLVTLFKKAGKIKGYFSRNLFSLLERRLDVAVYRSGFTQTIAEARQLIKHNKIRVNDRRVTVSNYLLNAGDIIGVVSETQLRLPYQILNILNGDKVKHHSKILEHYSSRLKKVAPFKDKNSNSKKNLESTQNPFDSRRLCHLLIHCLLSRLKSRSFFSLVSESDLQDISPFLLLCWGTQKPEHTSKQFQNLKKKNFCTLLKWKSSFRLKSSKKKTAQQKQSPKKGNESHKIAYATGGCLEKKPLFWNQTVVSRILKKSSGVKTREVLKESHSFKTQNRLRLKMCFLLFLKHLSLSRKFRGLVSLNFKKSLCKKSINQSRFRVSQILHWRTSKPLHLETSYSLLTSVFLYTPQRVNLPFYIDLELIQRSLR